MRAPPLLPTLLAVPVVAILLNLGFWQVRRNGETGAEHQRFREQLELAPLSSLDEAQEGRRAELDGAWSGPTLLAGRVRLDQLGYELYQVLETDGERVLIDRGWVPADQTTLSSPLPVEGLLRSHLGDGAGSRQEARDGIPELWPGNDTLAMARELQAREDLYLVAGAELAPGSQGNPSTLPMTGYHATKPRRPHLAYAATWFSSAGFAVLIWAVLWWRRQKT